MEGQGIHSQAIREEYRSGGRQVEIMVTQSKVLQKGQRRKYSVGDEIHGEWKQAIQVGKGVTHSRF